MPSIVLSFAILSIIYLIYKYVNRTDVPKIKGIPEIPGVPLFGNLIQLGIVKGYCRRGIILDQRLTCNTGQEHAKIAQAWVKKYGPVFQVRLGNKVSKSIRDY